MIKNTKINLLEVEINDDLRRKVISLLLKLKKLKNNLIGVHYAKNEKLFFNRMWDMWSFFENYDDEEVYEVFSHTREFSEYVKFFKEKNFYFERALDSAEALNIIAQNPENDILDLLDHNFSKKVFMQTSSEIQQISEKKINKLVMVGCGPMPETVIGIAENTNIRNIIGLDINPEAIMMAGRVINKLGFNDSVNMKCIAGENFDYSDADVIHIANFVRGKKEVLNRISMTAKSGAIIIARQTRLLSNLAYEEIYPVLHPRLVLKGNYEGAFYRFSVFEKFGFEV